MLRLFSGQAAREDARVAPSAAVSRPAPAPGEERLPPEPRIQVNAAADMDALRRQEAAVLTTYGWVDRQAGIVRIPIDVAMTQILEEGLPVRQPDSAPPAAGTPAPAATRRKARRRRFRNEDVGSRAGALGGAGVERVGAAAAVHRRGHRRSAGRNLVGARAGRAREGRHRSEAEFPGAARRGLPCRGRPGGQARRVLRKAARRAVAGLLRVPDAVHAGAQRRRGGVQGAELQHRRRVRRGHPQLRPQGNAGDGVGEEGDLPQQVRTPRGREGLALPDGRPGVHRGAGVLRRVPVHVRPGVAAVRARERPHGADARRPRVEVLLRDRLPAEGPAARPHRGVGREDRHAGGPGAALLLPLRPALREVQHGGDERPPAGGGRHGGPDWRVHRDDVGPRSPEIEARARPRRKCSVCLRPRFCRRRPPPWRPRWTPSTSSWSR